MDKEKEPPVPGKCLLERQAVLSEEERCLVAGHLPGRTRPPGLGGVSGVVGGGGRVSTGAEGEQADLNFGLAPLSLQDAHEHFYSLKIERMPSACAQPGDAAKMQFQHPFVIWEILIRQ